MGACWLIVIFECSMVCDWYNRECKPMPSLIIGRPKDSLRASDIAKLPKITSIKGNQRDVELYQLRSLIVVILIC
jgi:hypothetical protein